MNPSGESHTAVDPAQLLAGGGEMGERTRAFPWSDTPLGPVHEWPQALKTVLRTMLNSRYAMWLGWGPDLVFFYNDAYARMTLGPRHPWALGKPASQVWSEIWSDIGPRAESVLRTGQATWDEGLLLFLERRGFPEETYHTFSYSPVPDDRGGVGGLLCVVTEDTERTIGERRLRTLRELAARTTDSTTSVRHACESAARTLAGNPRDLPFVLLYLLDDKGTRAELVGATGLEPNAPPAPASIDAEPAALWPICQVADSGRAVVVDDVEARFGPLAGGAWPEPVRRAAVLPLARPGQSRPAGFLVAGISPRLVFSDDYRGFLELLAGQVSTAVANARAYEEERRRAEALAETDRAKTVFFSNISHEFRTPLTLMLGPLDDLLAGNRDDLPPATREQLQIVNRNGVRLLRLVNTLLDFSRIEAGRVRAVFQPTDLAAFTADLASNFRSACERAGLRLTVDCHAPGEPVFVDREMWEKIVLNLLSNAFKFTFQGAISVSLRQAGEAVELRVQDTGIGIAAEEMPRLFERFHRIEKVQGRTHEGSGIGLALVQDLVKLHGGSIVAESEIGQGTTFTIALPCGCAHLPAGQVSEGRGLPMTTTAASAYVEEALRWLPESDSGDGDASGSVFLADSLPALRPTIGAEDRPRILLAEDNADMRQYLTRLLAEHYTVEAVADGAAALAAIRQRPPSLVLTDAMMPRLDGFELLDELRRDPVTSSLPIIMLSARAGEESRVEGLEAGADAYLVKPFSARELLAGVSAQLQMARLRREAGESLRQSEERLRLALIAARMVAWEWTPPMGSIILSDNAATVLGLSEFPYFDEWLDLVHSEDEPRVRAAMCQAADDGTSFLLQFRAIRPDTGALLWLEDRGYAVRDAAGSVVRLVGVLLDVTASKQAENALKDADRRKDEFLATLAHELRNPLAPLRNGLQIMQLARGDQEMLDQARAMMERQLCQMVHLVDDLLDMSRISRGKIELRREPIELGRIVQHAVETSRPVLHEAGHELTLTLPPEPIFVDADMTRLSQVLANLLNNAAKYTDRGGRVGLAVERQGKQALVSVKDNGVGIPPHMIAKVFDMFTQVDRSRARAQGGLGIGLSIVKRLVEMHGGTVEARSDGEGLGSEFVICLPTVEGADQRHAGNGREPAAAEKQRRILVVDDNRDAAVSLALMLNIMGNEARTAHSGWEALEVAAAFQPELVMLDIGMPEIDGYETARRMRVESWGSSASLVALTGWGQEDDRRKSQEAGFDFHLVKPIEPAALKKLLAQLRVGSG